MFKEQKYLANEVKSIMNLEEVIPLFIFTGSFTFHEVNSHLISLKQYLESHISTKITKRNIYSILVECVENINKHGFGFENDNQIVTNYGYVIFAFENNKYKIFVGNFINQDEIEYIESTINEINLSDIEDLKEVYRDKLENNELSKKQGMGIGIIDIALRSKEPIKLTTKKYSENASFFSLEITVTK